MGWSCGTYAISTPSPRRDLDDEVPTIELVVGDLATNRSPSLKSFLSKLGTLISRVSESQHFPIDSATAK